MEGYGYCDKGIILGVDIGGQDADVLLPNGQVVAAHLPEEKHVHTCDLPASVDFRDPSSNGCWVEEATPGKGDWAHYVQVRGSSGVYLIVTDLATGEVIRDDRPWQMVVA